MASYTRQVVINEVPERVFDYLTNQEKLHEWSFQVVKSEVKGDVPIQQGSILLQVRKQGNRTIKSEVEVIKHDRPDSHIVHVRVMGVDATFNFSLQKQENATKVTLIGEVKGRGIGILLAPFLKKVMEKGDDKVLEYLKKAIEKNHRLD